MLSGLRAGHADQSQQSEEGFSLAELLVTMTLMLFVGAIATTMLVATSSSASNTGSQSLIVSRARIALSSIASMLQAVDSPTSTPGSTANRFDTMTVSQLVFYTDQNNRSSQSTRTAPIKVSLQFSGTQLIESIYQPTSTTASGTSNYPTNPTTTVTMLGGDSATLASTGSGFTYCTNAAPTSSPAASPTASASPAAPTCAASNATTASTAAQVATVGITLVLAGPGSSTQTLTTSVAVPGLVSS